MLLSFPSKGSFIFSTPLSWEKANYTSHPKGYRMVTLGASRRASLHLHLTSITPTPALPPSGSVSEKNSEAAKRGDGDKQLCRPSVPPSWEETLRSSLLPQFMWEKQTNKNDPSYIPEKKQPRFLASWFLQVLPSPVNSTHSNHHPLKSTSCYIK